MQRLLPGRLIWSPHNTPWGDKVFYACRQKRHWAPSANHLHSYGMSLDEVALVSCEEMRQYSLAGPMPLIWPDSAWEHPPRTSPLILREIATSKLRGSGIEFGAGTSPVSVPLDCEVRFADFVPEHELRDRAYPMQGDDFVPLSYVMGMEDMSAIPERSLDFVIAAHVIEHLRNPLRALEQAYLKLKPGGYLVLIVPEQTRATDRERALTSLQHLVSDYENPSAERDAEDYYDFFAKSKADGLGDPAIPLEVRVREGIAAKRDIHYHVWTHDSFRDLVEYSQRGISPWRSVWSQPAIEGVQFSDEFYYALQA
jgi:SAM-dependent methyltransferase